MNEEKTKEILHDIRRIAELIGEWESKDREMRDRIIKAFDELYKDLESEIIVKHD